MSETICAPVAAVVTQGFGNIPTWDPDFYARWGYPGHNGIDYGALDKTPVTGALSARLSKIGFEANGFGNFAVQDCGSFWLYYCHLDAVFAKVGDLVEQGRAFAYSGHSGACYPPGEAGAHLHFGKRVKTYAKTDPWKGWREPFVQEVITMPTEYKVPKMPKLPQGIVRVDGLVVRRKPGTTEQATGMKLSSGQTVQVIDSYKQANGDIWLCLGYLQWVAGLYQGKHYVAFE